MASDPGEREAVLNSPDTDDDGTINVERFPLPSAAGISDPYLAEVWEMAAAEFPGGEYDPDDDE